MGNAVAHFEIAAPDDGELVVFYRELFGWGLHGQPGGGYTVIDTRGGYGINGGIGRSRADAPWSAFYVETDDLQATLDRVNALGGRTAIPVTGVGGAGAKAMFTDPDGLLVGLIQASAGASRADEPGPSDGLGAPATWFEVMGSDAARTQQFYADLFGWTADRSFPAYAAVDTGAGRGIQGGLGGGVEAHWAIVYVRVADADQTLGRAEKLGGSRITDQSVPTLKSAARAALYGFPDESMQTGAFRDPAGNVFGIFAY
ncbi:MAG: VOC family protein [Streptosporangiaceae bacterium]